MSSQAESTAPPPPGPAAAIASDPVPPPIITTPKCIIRLHHPSDIAAMQRAADSPAVAKYMSYRFASPYTLEDAQRWLGFAMNFKAPGTDILTSYAICDPVINTYLGGIGVKTREDIEENTFEVGYWIGEASWGKGIMTEALRAYAKWVFRTFPNVIRLEGNTFGANEASAKVLRNAGFVYEGTRRKAAVKHGVVYDVLMFSLLREECPLDN
ncbi:acyl-CoA N-acyltransferase [Achaetomium macrosporum]|uniref:Acyl-CoA N-acyltransferase n=1 Tax=Achaetomium macrosporum TaxID=79813 RepID=A0AAN7CGQ2_9PEZI|nr:acyl-CoA N-acyltransferase [Achaetomium macrosporum]